MPINQRLDREFDATSDLVIGEPEAQVKVVWYLDYNGARLRKNRTLVLDVLQRIRETGASVAIRPFGLDEISQTIARLATSAEQQGKFADFHLALIRHSGELTEQTAIQIASSVGLDIDQLRDSAAHDEVAAQVTEHREAVEAFGAEGPGLFIDKRRYDGVWDEDSVVEAIRRPWGFLVRETSQAFFSWAASAGMVLVLATVAALVAVNIGFHDQYEHLREMLIGVTVGNWAFELSAEQWINDGLMGVFFLIVGIEIKREIVDGELSTLSNAMLPILGAIGGMVVPAAIYAAINMGHDTVSGWGVPMATDIAFTLGLMALLGRRVPAALKVFVSALAIADDLGAILVIAIFYGEGFHLAPLLWAGGVLAVMFAMNIGRVYARAPYLILGALLWLLVHESGLHATLAGVLTALAIPSRRSGSMRGVAAQTSAVFESELATANHSSATIGGRSLRKLHSAIERLREPGYHLQHALEHWTNFLVLPLFAFFNMGIVVFGAPFHVTSPESLGVIVGLLIGKPLGIVAICWLAVKTGLAQLPSNVSWRQIVGAGCLAGVGFTMSIFIATAAFEEMQLQSVKLSVLIASTLSAILGMCILRRG